MAKTLDKQKPFGTIHGDDQGRAYVQDGVYFDGEGNEWQAPAPGPTWPEPVEPVEPVTKTKAK